MLTETGVIRFVDYPARSPLGPLGHTTKEFSYGHP